MKAPRITEAAARLADHARDAGWTHEEYLAAVLDREVAARNASGAQLRIRAAGFAARKTIEEFDWDAQPAVRQQIAALASGGFLTEARNVVLLGPPGTGKTHLATGLGIAAAHHGHRVLFATATEWVTRLTDAHRAGRLPQELTRLRRYGLIIVDEVGYLPFEQDAANLFFQLVSSRYEHASLILTSQPAVQRLGRRLRRPSRRRRDDRPRRPPRRRPHPQGRQLPATQPRDRHPAQHQNPRHGRLETQRTGGLVFERRIGLIFERCRHVLIRHQCNQKRPETFQDDEDQTFAGQRSRTTRDDTRGQRSGHRALSCLR